MFRKLKPHQLIVDVTVAALFGCVALPWELSAGRATDHNALSTALICVLFAGALALRRLSPGLALTAAWAGAIVQMSFLRQPSAVDIAIFAVLYATAAYGSKRVFWSGFASAVFGAIVITVYLFAPSFGAMLPELSTITTVVAVLIAALFGLGLSWTVGALVRTAIRARDNRLAQERAQAETVAEQERVRIARDMHDVVAHSLAVVIAQADGARYATASARRPSGSARTDAPGGTDAGSHTAGSGSAGAEHPGGTDPAAVASAAADPAANSAADPAGEDSVAVEALTTIAATARAALADVRLLLTQLRHSQGDGPQPTLADLELVYAQIRAAGVDLRVDVDPIAVVEPPAAIQLGVFRIVQEALTNALRHGGEGHVDVGLAWHPDRVDLTVRNALPGPSPRPASVAGAVPGRARTSTSEQIAALSMGGRTHGGGHGLIGMRERAHLVGGSLDASAEGGTWLVRASLPIGATR